MIFNNTLMNSGEKGGVEITGVFYGLSGAYDSSNPFSLTEMSGYPGVSAGDLLVGFSMRAASGGFTSPPSLTGWEDVSVGNMVSRIFLSSASSAFVSSPSVTLSSTGSKGVAVLVTALRFAKFEAAAEDDGNVPNIAAGPKGVRLGTIISDSFYETGFSAYPLIWPPSPWETLYNFRSQVTNTGYYTRFILLTRDGMGNSQSANGTVTYTLDGSYYFDAGFEGAGFSYAPPSAPITNVISSSSTFVVPAGVTSIDVLSVGGGGSNSTFGSGEGGGGAVAYSNNVSVSPGDEITITVDASGTAVSGTGFTVFAEAGKSAGTFSNSDAAGGSAANSQGDVTLSGRDGSYSDTCPLLNGAYSTGISFGDTSWSGGGNYGGKTLPGCAVILTGDRSGFSTSTTY